MAVIIEGENKGICLNGNVFIERVEFVPGDGVKSVSGIRMESPDAEVELGFVPGKKDKHLIKKCYANQ